MVYGTPVISEEDLIARVHGAIESPTRQPYLFGHLCEAQRRLCRLCNDVDGKHYEAHARVRSGLLHLPIGLF